MERFWNIVLGEKSLKIQTKNAKRKEAKKIKSGT
jgi:hypothetical protein